jgi:demethylmenaquinone methyltransferase/2-methoxy-6-polyprenyl-1,4-benzoquinol methylase
MPSKTVEMFDSISGKYDRINTYLSLGMDNYWRKTLTAFLPKKQKIKLLDCATGTGDQLLTLLKHAPQIYDAVGIDPSQEMLALARGKLLNFSYKAQVLLGSAEDIPFPNEMFDAVTISFGIRNVADVLQSLKEFHRVLAPNGRLLILEFSHPQFTPIRFLHKLYLNHFVPRLGKWLSGNQAAYSYLSNTIEAFPQGKAFCAILKEAQFKEVRAKPLTLGAVTLYICTK